MSERLDNAIAGLIGRYGITMRHVRTHGVSATEAVVEVEPSLKPWAQRLIRAYVLARRAVGR